MSWSYATVVGKLHRWFESMHGRRGYGGPVSHWWRDSLRYTGPGFDWRYEGIIHGYLHLFETTGDEQWLNSARTAGQELVAGQVKSGNFYASAFERNPELAGTPHEACASAALLRLARVLLREGYEWKRYAEPAERNVKWHVEALWDERARTFSDTVGLRSYVPNKIASTVDAVLRLLRLGDGKTDLERYVRPATETIVSLQEESGPYCGGIHQISTRAPDRGNAGDGKFFPLYIARCIPVLLAVAAHTDDSRFLDAAVAAGEFLRRVEHENGSFPQVVYRNGQRNDAPRWIAGVGDVLRAYERLNDHGYGFTTRAVEEWLQSGFDDCGAFRTAQGFGRVTRGIDQPVFQDVLHVVGWNDKAFRWLAERTTASPTPPELTEAVEIPCRFRGTDGAYLEDDSTIKFVPAGRTRPRYQWMKGERWAHLTD